MVKLKLEELSEGMIIAEPVNDPRSGKLLLKCDTKLTEALIESLRTHNVDEVAIFERYTLSINPTDITRKELRQVLSEEISRLAPEKAEANPTDKMTIISRHILGLVDNIFEDDNIVNFCVQMKVQDNDYIYKHCVGTCALSLLVAGVMDLDDEQIVIIGKAALLHDLGICEMAHIVRHNNKSAQEEALWREHPSYGYFSARQFEIDESISKLILYHHENWDGSGFPEKLKGEAIPLGSRIIAVCETYDRLLRYERYPHYQVIEYLYGGWNYFFDSKVIEAFAANLAVYPLGSLVRLSDGEVGVVVNVRKNSGARPVVRIFFNRVNRPYKIPKDVDLGMERTLFIKEIIR